MIRDTRTSSCSSRTDDTSISARYRELGTGGMSLELRARAPPIFDPFVTFGLPLVTVAIDSTCKSRFYMRTYTLP